MAFRRKFPRARRRFSRAPVARKKRTWVTALTIDPCNPLRVPFCIPTDGCCTTKFKMILMDQNTMQQLFSDRLSIVRIIGNLWIVPDPLLFGATPDQAYARLAAIQSEMFFGLKRGETTTQSASATSDIWDVTGTDLSEFQWLKTWHHRWEAFDGAEVSVASNSVPIDFNLSIPVGTDDTHTHIGGVEACNELATGTGTICIETDHSVDCEVCAQQIPANALQQLGVKLHARPNWHVHIDVKKKIPMRENQELYLMFNGRNPQNAFDDQVWEVKGNLRCLVEMG